MCSKMTKPANWSEIRMQTEALLFVSVLHRLQCYTEGSFPSVFRFFFFWTETKVLHALFKLQSKKTETWRNWCKLKAKDPIGMNEGPFTSVYLSFLNGKLNGSVDLALRPHTLERYCGWMHNYEAFVLYRCSIWGPLLTRGSDARSRASFRRVF